MFKNQKNEKENAEISQVDSALQQSKSQILSNLFNLFASKKCDSKVERALVFVNDILKFAPLLMSHFNLKSEKEYLSKRIQKTPVDVRQSIQNWYDENPEHQAVASSEFRKPEYPVLKKF